MIALGANAIGGSGKPLGIVAVGSGNDFARGLELPGEPYRDGGRRHCGRDRMRHIP